MNLFCYHRTCTSAAAPCCYAISKNVSWLQNPRPLWKTFL